MSRLQRGRTAPATAPAAKPAVKRGSQGIAQAEEEARLAKERRDAPRQPWRFRADVGEDNPIIILDDFLTDAAFIYEHSVKGADGKFSTETCTSESGYCPLCNLVEGGAKHIKHKSYTMLLSVLDLRGYVNKDKKEVPYSKRLMAAKGTAQTELLKVLQKINDRKDKHGKPLGIRGTYMNMQRLGDKEASCGTPGMIEDSKGNHTLYEVLSEAELEQDYYNKAIKDKDTGRVLKKEGDDIEPYDYEAMFPMPDPDALARKYSARSSAGGQEDINDGWEEGTAPRRGRRTRQVEETTEEAEDETPAPRRGRRAAPEPEPEDAETDAEEVEDEAPAPRRRRSAAAEPEPEAEEAEEEAEEDEEPAPRRGRVTSRRAAQEEDADEDADAGEEAEDEGEEETPEPPPRTRAGRGRSAPKDEEPAPRGRAAAAKAGKGRRAGKPF